MNDIIAMLKCKHALDTKENEIGEELCFCERWDNWRNITLGECFGNCDCEHSANRDILDYLNDEEECEELHAMCDCCENYAGRKEHDFSECREMPCFKNWLGLEYLDWINGY